MAIAGSCLDFSGQYVYAQMTCNNHTNNLLTSTEYGTLQPILATNLLTRLSTLETNLSTTNSNVSALQNAVIGSSNTTLNATLTSVSATPTDKLNDFTDGATLGWGIVAAMVVAWAIKAAIKALS